MRSMTSKQTYEASLGGCLGGVQPGKSSVRASPAFHGGLIRGMIKSAPSACFVLQTRPLAGRCCDGCHLRCIAHGLQQSGGRAYDPVKPLVQSRLCRASIGARVPGCPSPGRGG